MKRGPANTVEPRSAGSRASEQRAFGRRGADDGDIMVLGGGQMLGGGGGSRPPSQDKLPKRSELATDTTDIRKKSFTYSAIMHAVVFLLIVFGLPSLFDRQLEPEEQAITAEILPISTVSNVRPSAPPKPQPQQTPPKPVSPPKQEKPAPTPPKPEEKKPEPKPEPLPTPKEKPKVQEKPKEEPKEKPKEQAKPKEKPKEAPTLDQILKDIKAKAEQQPQPKTLQAVDNPSEKPATGPFNPTMPLSLSEKDAIRQQIQRNWNIPAGAKDAMNLVVLLNIKLNRDGTVRSVDVVDRGRYGSDSFYRAAADSAVRAVRKSSPLLGLSQEKYASWEELELNFDPKEMLY